jgi:hypothetical protein
MPAYVTIDHDCDPDFSWLEQDMYDPSSPEFDPIYRSREDMDAGHDPIDPEWYRDPDNHVALCMIAHDDEDNGKVVDSLGSIDFLADGDDWCTGTFYSVKELERRGCAYLAELAREMGVPE